MATLRISGSQCPTCEDPAATSYDAAGNVVSRTDYKDTLTCYANDPARGLELVRVEGFTSGSSCLTNLASYTPATGTQQRKITCVDPTFRLPASITEARRTPAFTYDATGNLRTRTLTDTTATPNVLLIEEMSLTGQRACEERTLNANRVRGERLGRYKLCRMALRAAAKIPLAIEKTTLR